MMPPGAPAVLILAPARSGSSIAAAVLGQHPDLYGTPELRLFHVDTVDALLSDQIPSLSTTVRMAGLLRTIAELHEGSQTAASVERALGWLQSRRQWSTARVFRYIQSRVLPRAVVEKSPETVRTDGALARAMATCPDARLVHLVRHPWATVASMVDAWLGLPSWHVTPEIAHEYCARIWFGQHERIVRMTAAHANRTLRVRAEDITDPASSALEDFCRLANIESTDLALAAMRRPDRSPFARRGPTNAAGGFDPKFLERPQLRPLKAPKTLTPPSNWQLHPDTVTRVRMLARQFGYDESVEQPAPRRRRRVKDFVDST